ncbi:MAG: glycosyltransferase [Candidatus Zixiibacteriota bacterium]
MRICFLADGKSYHTQRWVNYFAEKGHQCHLLSLEKGIRTKAYHHILKSNSPVNALKFILAVPQVKYILKEIAPHMLNAHFASAYGFTGALTGFRPLVVSCWGSDVLISPKKSFLHKLRVKHALSKADLLTSDGQDMADAIEKLGVIKKKIVISPMGVDQSLLEKCKGKRPSQETFTILSARKLEPLYNLKTLVLAASEVVKKFKGKVKFIIIGEGSQKQNLLGLSQKLGLNEYVEFKDFLPREEFLNLFQQAHLYLSTSLSDSTSVALLEAMASGIIPVVTDIPGNREWIMDGKNGFLFSPEDHKALAEKIIYAIDNFENLNRIRGENLALIKKRALWQDNMKRIEDSFLELIKE